MNLLTQTSWDVAAIREIGSMFSSVSNWNVIIITTREARFIQQVCPTAIFLAGMQ